MKINDIVLVLIVLGLSLCLFYNADSLNRFCREEGYDYGTHYGNNSSMHCIKRTTKLICTDNKEYCRNQITSQSKEYPLEETK